MLVYLQGVGADMKDPFEAYRKSKSYSFLGSRIGKSFILFDMLLTLLNTEAVYKY